MFSLSNNHKILFVRNMFRFITLSVLTVFLNLTYSQESEATFSSLNQKLTFYNFDSESGLSNNMVNSIEQDSLGFIWIATTEGINRFDGTEFKVYRNELNQKDGLSNNHVKQIIKGHNTELLFATDEGLNIYSPRLKTFNVFTPSIPFTSNSISNVTYSPSGELIIATYDEGVHFMHANSSTQFYTHNPSSEASLSSNKISSIALQGDSIVWLGTFDNGLNKLTLKTKKIERIVSKNKESSYINCLKIDQEGNLWVGSKSGLTVITTVGDTLELSKSTSKNGLSDDDIRSFEEDNVGRMWIGTFKGGLNIINENDLLKRAPKFSVQWYLPKDDGSSVYNRTVSALKLDREGNMWIGTSTGINFVNPNGEPIKLLKNAIANSESLSHDRIGALAQSKDGSIWIGTDGGGLDLYSPSSGNFKHFIHKSAISLSNNYIQSLLEDRKGRLWIGTYQGGINRTNPQKSSCNYYLQKNVENGSDVRIIYEAINGEIWVGTNRGGLYRYVENEDRFKYVESLGKMDIRDICEDSQGSIWLATYGNGIINLNPNTENYTFFDKNNTEGIKTNVIFCLLPLKNGDILAGTRYGGLLRFSPESNQVKNFTEADGLSNNTINSMVQDSKGVIWLGTFKGISSYDPITNSVDNLNTMDNIQMSEFNIGAALMSKSGNLYFGGNKGLNIFNPKDINKVLKSYPIIFNDLKILNTSVPVNTNETKSILEESLSYKDNLILPYDKTFFSIDFAVLKYPSAHNISYSYILEGYNNQWIDLKNSTRINFSKIPAGNYVLKLKAKSGTSNTTFKQLALTITPPFWKTMPAYILYSILTALMIWSALRYYSERVYLKNSLLFEKKQRKLEHELNEERIRFYTGFSHELKTPLTLILAPIESLMSKLNGTEHRNNLYLIKRNANELLNTINKLLDFRKSEEGLSKLHIGNYNITKHLARWVSLYQPLAKQKNINLCFEQPPSILIDCDLEKIQIILNNLLSNALKYTSEKGKIEVKIVSENEFLKIIVTDSGSGINKQDLEHIFEWYYHSDSTLKKDGTGIGLALSKRFSELHKGNIEVISKPGLGSTFVLSLPLHKNVFDDSAFIILESGKEKEELENRLSEELLVEAKPHIHHALIQPELNRDVILLIDDNPDILLFLNSVLKDEYDIIHAINGIEGVEKACQYVPDLIISDVMMPMRNGIDMCHILKKKKQTSHIPIILLSAKGNSDIIETGYNEGADDYIVKPFNIQILKARIRNLIESRKMLQVTFSNAISKDDSSNEQSQLLKTEKKFLTEFEDVVLKYIQSEVTVEAVAKAMGMSRTSLFRKIKALTGKNINEYIRSIKLKKATYLIEKENYTISQAAFEVGFNNAKYFRKIFKKEYGQLPSELTIKNQF